MPLSAFKTANSAKPAEIYPTQKITEIQAILDKTKSENETLPGSHCYWPISFSLLEKYREALEPYQRASTIKPA